MMPRSPMVLKLLVTERRRCRQELGTCTMELPRLVKHLEGGHRVLCC